MKLNELFLQIDLWLILNLWNKFDSFYLSGDTLVLYKLKRKTVFFLREKECILLKYNYLISVTFIMIDLIEILIKKL